MRVGGWCRAGFVVATLAAALALVGAGCTDEGAGVVGADEGAGARPTTSADAGAGHTSDPAADWTRPDCDLPVAEPVRVEPVEGVPSDVVMTSFDGTPIRAHWFPLPDADAERPAPTVLMGPGWSLPGDTDVEAVGILGSVDIASLRAAGYNVLTWDPRGFGSSGGVATVNDAEREGRDVQLLLDWVATLPEVRLDAPGDPSVGMVGGSYGGGIQLVTAAIDCRVDAIVPMIAWHSLGTSLYKAETVKTGWAGVLADLPTGAVVDSHVDSAHAEGVSTGVLSEENVEWFRSRGPAQLVEQVRVPTLLVQGTVDTLFTLDEALTNLEIIEGNGVPSAMTWFCGGHGTCLTEPGDPGRVVAATTAWLDRWVRGDEDVDTGPRIDLIDQHGNRYVAESFPEPSRRLEAEGRGTLQLVAEGGSGPAVPPEGSTEVLDGISAPITPARASNAVEVELTMDEDAHVLGTPMLQLSYRGEADPGPRPTRLFAQLVDERSGLVLDNQITPVPLELDGETHEVSVPLEVVSFAAVAGDTITLQLVATTVAYAEPRLGGAVAIESAQLSLPVVDGLERVGPE